VTPSAPASVLGVIRGECPRCRALTLFDGWLSFAKRCRACGLDFGAFNVGDGPAAFLILIVGAIVTGGAIALELAASPAYWVHLVWVPVAAFLTVGGLRIGKAWLLAQEYRNEAREGRIKE
jgi:uncharacterized protein (DUF983 family)